MSEPPSPPTEASVGVGAGAGSAGDAGSVAKDSRLWEMELLVSGATVVGLLQLPSKLDALMGSWMNLASGRLNGLLLPTWIYAKVAIFTLIFTFILHLTLRGFWVALVGLSEVYPLGVDANKLARGPLRRADLRTLPSTQVAIANADRRATLTFSVGFAAASMMLVPFFLALIASALVLVVQSAHRGSSAVWVLAGFGLLALTPLVIASAIDDLFGRRIDPGSRVGRAVVGVLGAYRRVGFRGNYLMSLFRSNAGRVGTAMVIVLLAVVSATVMVQQGLENVGAPELGDSRVLPIDTREAANNLLAAHYADQRSGSQPKISYIPSRVVSGLYLPLFVPYRAALFEPSIAKRCPSFDQTDDRRAALNCLAQILDIRIDGEPQTVALDAATDATDLRGVMAMLPVEKLAEGRHELTLSLPGQPLGERILFWK